MRLPRPVDTTKPASCARRMKGKKTTGRISCKTELDKLRRTDKRLGKAEPTFQEDKSNPSTTRSGDQRPKMKWVRLELHMLILAASVGLCTAAPVFSWLKSTPKILQPATTPFHANTEQLLTWWFNGLQATRSGKHDAFEAFNEKVLAEHMSGDTDESTAFVKIRAKEAKMGLQEALDSHPPGNEWFPGVRLFRFGEIPEFKSPADVWHVYRDLMIAFWWDYNSKGDRTAHMRHLIWIANELRVAIARSMYKDYTPSEFVFNPLALDNILPNGEAGITGTHQLLLYWSTLQINWMEYLFKHPPRRTTLLSRLSGRRKPEERRLSLTYNPEGIRQSAEWFGNFVGGDVRNSAVQSRTQETRVAARPARPASPEPVGGWDRFIAEVSTVAPVPAS